MLAHLLVLSHRELIVCVHPVEVAVKTCLKCETVHDVELAPHHDSSSFEFGLLQAKPARVISEFLGLFSEQLRYDAHSQVLF